MTGMKSVFHYYLKLWLNLPVNSSCKCTVCSSYPQITGCILHYSVHVFHTVFIFVFDLYNSMDTNTCVLVPCLCNFFKCVLLMFCLLDEVTSSSGKHDAFCLSSALPLTPTTIATVMFTIATDKGPRVNWSELI